MEFDLLLAMADGTEKTAALAAWVQSLFEEGEKPVLVGGAAVELYTGGAYTTGDLDFVGTPNPICARTACRGRLYPSRKALDPRGWAGIRGISKRTP